MNKITRTLFAVLILSTIIQVAPALEGNKDLMESQEVIPTEMWNRTYTISCIDPPNACGQITKHVQQTIDGGFILIGFEYDNLAPGPFGSAWIMKTDILGNKLWEKTFGGDGEDGVYSGQQTTDGGYILAGSKCISEPPDYYPCWMTHKVDGWLIKTDDLGNKLWEDTFGGVLEDEIKSVQQTKDGGYVLAGYTNYIYEVDKDAWLVKVDPNGNIKWSKIFEELGEDEIKSVRQTKDGGYILVGCGTCYNDSKKYTRLIKTDSLGNKQWEKIFEEDAGNTVQQTKDGGYILIGDSWFIKTDSFGNKQWEKTSGGNDIQQTNDGGYIFIGDSQLAKTDSFGNKQWEKIFKEDAGGNAVQQTKDGGYIVAAYQWYHYAQTATLTKLEGDYMASINLLKNPGFETVSGTLPQYWTKSQTGARAVFTYPATVRVGGKSVAIKYTTKETGKVALWQQAGIAIVPSKQYKLSGYMKLEGVTGGGTGRLNGASLRINWYTSTGTLIKVDLITKSGTIGWAKYENIFTAPSNAVKANVGGDLFNAAGKVTFDDLSFVRT